MEISAKILKFPPFRICALLCRKFHLLREVVFEQVGSGWKWVWGFRIVERLKLWHQWFHVFENVASGHCHASTPRMRKMLLTGKLFSKATARGRSPCRHSASICCSEWGWCGFSGKYWQVYVAFIFIKLYDSVDIVTLKMFFWYRNYWKICRTFYLYNVQGYVLEMLSLSYSNVFDIKLR